MGPFDEARDATSLPLIRRAIERGIPLPAICRGIQELNVALGGTLVSEVQDQPGRIEQIARALAPLVDVLGIGQLIYERFGSTSWVHVSTRVPDKRVNRVITITSAGTQLGVQEV